MDTHWGLALAVVTRWHAEPLLSSRLSWWLHQEFEVADLTKMIASGYARCIFAGEMEPRLREAAGTALSGTGFEQKSRSYTIEGIFEDDNIALFKVGENDEVLPDDERAVAKGAADPRFVSGEDLAERAKLCTISKTNNGRLNLPLVRSSDLRVCGPKIMVFQTTILSELYLQAEDGWAAEVAGCKTFDHAETQAAPDASYSAMTFSRKHLRPDTKQLDSTDVVSLSLNADFARCSFWSVGADRDSMPCLL